MRTHRTATALPGLCLLKACHVPPQQSQAVALLPLLCSSCHDRVSAEPHDRVSADPVAALPRVDQRLELTQTLPLVTAWVSQLLISKGRS